MALSNTEYGKAYEYACLVALKNNSVTSPLPTEFETFLTSNFNAAVQLRVS